VTDARISIAPVFGAPSGRPPSPRVLGWLLCCLGVAAALAATAARPAGPRLAAAQDWPPFVLVAGLVYSFNAPFYGSEAGKSLPGPITGIVADGTCYLLVGRDGSVYNFNTPFYGSEAGKKPPSPVIGITAAG